MRICAPAVPIAFFYFASFTSPCVGQQTPPPGQAFPGGDAARWIQLPPWLRLGVEFRGRAEADLDPDQDRDDRLYLNRIRLSATFQPIRWVRFFVQGQDARAVSFAGAPVDDQRNPVELHEGYAELGRTEEGWQLRFGRQELAIGDERLVAADTYWDWFGQSFDAVRVAYGQNRWRVDSFAGFRVEPAARRVNPFDAASRIAGVTGTIKAHGGSVQPYLIWKRGEDIRDLMLRPGHKDVAALGVLVRGDLPQNLDFDVEMALERGHVVTDSVSAWAGHWELGWRPWGTGKGPRFGLEYNYASGDRNPGDGRYQTFDDMYPAGYNKFGMMDPIAWRNIRYPLASVEVPVQKYWRILGGYRTYRLAEVQDGLYLGGDDFLTRSPGASSSHVGSQFLVALAYERSPHVRVYSGYGVFLSGAYLRDSGCGTTPGTFYVQPSYTF